MAVAVVDPLPGLLRAFTAPNGSIRRSDALAAIGLTVRRPVAVFCERQVGAQCGQHAMNNVLQEDKSIRIEGDATNLIVGPRNECRSIVELLRDRTIKVNMRALCSVNAGYCSGAGVSFYSDDALMYILKNILRYSTEYILATGRSADNRIQFVNNLVTSLTQPRVLGCILNQGNAHWTAITKFADSAASCPGRSYVFLNSTQVDTMVCLNQAELVNFLHVKFQESNLRSAITIFHQDGESYMSVASSRLLAQRAAAPPAIQHDRFRRAYELYREFVNNSRTLNYMRNHPDEFALDSVIRPALRTQNLNDDQIDLYLNEPTMTMNQYKNLLEGAITPAAPVATPERRRQRLLELYAAYSNDTRTLNILKSLSIRDLPESNIIDALHKEGVTDEFIDIYVGSNMSLENVENIFSPETAIPKPPLNVSKTRKNSRATAPAIVPTVAAPATAPRVATRTAANSRKIVTNFRTTVKNTKKRNQFERLFKSAKNARSANNMQRAINYANTQLRAQGK
jgi:hypothetical protein